LAARLRDGKAEIIGQLRRDYAGLRERWGGKDDYDRWFSRPLNNAQLNTIASYYQWVPRFHELLLEQGGDLEKFYADVRKLGRLPEAKRREFWSNLEFPSCRDLGTGSFAARPARKESMSIHLDGCSPSTPFVTFATLETDPGGNSTAKDKGLDMALRLG